MPDASNPHRQARQARQARRNPRLGLACSRCQRRKIRCDGQLPACNNCKKARVVCTDGESLRLRDLPRAQIANLKERIRWLEDIIRERCSDVDLSQGPPDDLDMHVDGDETFAPDSMIELSSGQPEANVTQHNARDIGRQSIASSESQPTTQPVIRSEPRMADTMASSTLSHEIGMVSLGSSQDSKYIGPSSGYFLARLMLTSNRQDDQTVWPTRPQAPTFSIPTALVEALHGPMPLPSKEHARQLAESYFDAINCQFPILHQPTFMNLLDQVYDSSVNTDRGTTGVFQVFMVLALGSIVLTRRLRAHLPGESYCLSAMQHFDRLSVDSSIPGLQCLLLLTIFTMHSPSMRLNVWYLNYQCIAAVLDLGLQRDINTDSGISLLEQEMRSRIFWVVFSLDRMIATMMGRPIGLRDEACDLRLPQDIDDASLQNFEQQPQNARPGRMAFSIHLFRLAKLNSEFKYVANSVVRKTPSYAYPAVIDINEWQRGMILQLDEWYEGIPEVPGCEYIRAICQVRCQGLRMLVLRPSPAIPSPSRESLQKCYIAARETLILFNQLYKQNLLIHTWSTCHSIVLGIITMLYCIKMVPEVARQTSLDILMSDFSAGLGVLAATGEHWSGVKRCRDILDDMVRATVRWIKDVTNNSSAIGSHTPRRSSRIEPTHAQTLSPYDDTTGPDGMPVASRCSSGGMSNPTNMSFMTAGVSSTFPPQEPFESFLSGTSFGEQLQLGDTANLDSIMRCLFDDFIPTYPSFS
ncbi:fungal-specific transcription factor domain-containing protein [Colletotrichum navitas]|uniref:Fungal-specific transcription factor domain-containing protein n=1 Tax=Colletotrichum navitas TaxID=681940 RepID=A0AAD8PMJ6_9PEZI|nr:fungal-specific transcription factor domain-containing protein [Colletotrichum navitas]KAK1572768.1 fungal-specific transcription factor domain-containing protein [Colletotrichum navitas]